MHNVHIRGIDESEASWDQFGSCRNYPLPNNVERLEQGRPELPDPFFEGFERDPFVRESVSELCAGCPVSDHCLQHGKHAREEGVYGGVYLSPGGILSRESNKHLDDEQWLQASERYDGL